MRPGIAREYTRGENARFHGDFMYAARPFKVLSMSLVAGLLSACASFSPPSESRSSLPPEISPEERVRETPLVSADRGVWTSPRESGNGLESRMEAELFPGTGRMINTQAVAEAQRVTTGDVMLNFENASLREVAIAVLEDILGMSFIISDGLDGRVTLHTSSPIPEDAVLGTLEMVLHMNGIALVYDEDRELWRIMRLDDAARAGHRLRLGRSGRPIPPGYQVRIMPLEYVGAREMQTILEPLMAPGTSLRVDTVRNLLFVTGTSQNLRVAEETVDLFDVDLLKGMSVGLYPLNNIEPDVVAAELEQIFGSDAEGPLSGMFRLIPVERLKAILVITPRPHYLREAQDWIRRLDRAEGEARGRNMYVYRLQNTNAADVAELLNQVYEGSGSSGGTASSRPGLAPGLQSAELGQRATGSQTGIGGESGQAGSSGATGQVLSGELGEIRIVADTVNNALVIMAHANDYEQLKKVIAELDIEPLQVLVDATIVEVSLQDDLRYGIQWFFKDSFGSSYRGEGIFGQSFPFAREFPGFNYSVIDGAGAVRALLTALASDNRVNVLSSPSLMVLDNRTAELRVGDEVPVRTSESVATVSENPLVTSTINFRDTGVLLTVTPRVNAGGLVTMEVSQEVSEVAVTQTSGIDSPTISQRQIRSTVAVQSGETIVLGGLIRERQNNSISGIPLLMDLPFAGVAFRNNVQETERTELIILLTPRVAGDQEAARSITSEYRRRLQGLEESMQRISPAAQN